MMQQTDVKDYNRSVAIVDIRLSIRGGRIDPGKLLASVDRRPREYRFADDRPAGGSREILAS